ncbi:MAG TPA: hypothetical protein DDW50_03915 [Firmicutes bacterium]|jgi:WD40 repeat protein|nr:hypothetical protein [Bacillota bacterium]
MKKTKLWIVGLILAMMLLSTVDAKLDLGKLKKIIPTQTTTEPKKTTETKDDSQDTKNANTQDTQGTVSNWKCLGKTDQPESKVVISPDNKMMLTIDVHGKVKIYDYQTLKVKQHIESDNRADIFISGAFYPNGQRIALGSKKGIAIYGMDGKLVQKSDVSAKNLLFSPSGTYLAANSGASITVLDANTLQTLSSISSCYTENFDFFKEDSLACLSLQGKLVFYSVKDGQEIHMAGPAVDESKSLIAVSDDQQLMYLGGGSKAQVVKTGDWSTLCRFDDNQAQIVAFKHGSHEIMCLNREHKLITIYNGENGKEVGQFHDDSVAAINGFTFDPNAQRLVVTSIKGLFIMGGPSDKALTIDSGALTPKPQLAFGTPSLWKRLFQTHTIVEDMAVSPDNQMILSVGADGCARVYDYNTLATKTIIKETNGKLAAGAFYPDGKSIALGTENEIAVYSIDGKLLKKSAIPTKNLALSPSGNYLVANNFDTLSVLDASTLKTLHTIKPFPYELDFHKYHFVFLKDDDLVYLSEDGHLVFYSLRDGKVVSRPQPAINETGSILAISDDGQLLFVGDSRQGQVYKMGDGSALCKLSYQYVNQAIFKHNSHDLFCFSSEKTQGSAGEIYTFNAEDGTQVDQLFDNHRLGINSFTSDQSGKRLLLAAKGLYIMGDANDQEIKLPDLGYHSMFVVHKTTIREYTEDGSKGGDFPLTPNMQVDVSNNDEMHTETSYWCKAQVTADGTQKEISGYIDKNYVSTKKGTTLDDLKAYKKVLQGTYPFKDFETIMKNPAAYPNCFGEYSGDLVGGPIEEHIADNGKGIPYLDVDYYGQRFLVEIPSSEFADDFDGMKGGGWSEGDQITLYLKFSHMGTYTNGLGMVFQIPVFRALALYDEYRVIYLKK